MRLINLFLKRFFDIFLGVIGIIISSPVVVIAIVAIKVTMPGPVFFKQERVGQNGKLFYILKLRTMKTDLKAEQEHDSSKDEERLTRTGKILRRLKIDELPQLLNVLVGDMSLVGPRPTIIEQVRNYNEYQKQRLKMRPGMTGLAQVNGGTALSWDERIKYDVKYVTEYSLGLDIKILLKTIKIILFGEEKYINPL